MLEKDKVGNIAILDHLEPIPTPQLEFTVPVEDELFKMAQRTQSILEVLEGFYEQLSKENELISTASSQMTHSVEQFEHYVSQFKTFEKTCKRNLVESLKSELNYSVKMVSETIAQEVVANSNEPIKSSLDTLCQLNENMKERYQEQKQSWKGFSVLLLLAALLAGSVGGLLVHHFTEPTKEMKIKLRAGEILMRSWTKLTVEEQEKIMKIGTKNVLNT